MFKSLEDFFFASIALTTMAAGLLLFAALPFGPGPASAADAPVRYEASDQVVRDALPPEWIPETPAPTSVSGPWHFESAEPNRSAAPGKVRPDRLSAPEGWTYDAGAPTE
jgi:hypothetical protein